MAKFIILLMLSLSLLDITRGEVCRDDVCEFILVVRHERTMTYRPATGKPYKVFLNSQSELEIEETVFKKDDDPMVGVIVNASDVVTGAGITRNIITVNGTIPGPTLEVEEGSQVVVKVWNKLQTDGVTIHWHGMHQRNNPWMDGAAQVNQCPIPPYQYFTYRFIADPAGTHWYHAHNGYQRLDGLSGMLIVNKKNTVPPYPVYSLMMADWFHHEAHTLEINNPYSLEAMDKGAGDLYHTHSTVRDYGVDGVEDAAFSWASGLINGRGRWREDIKLPLSVFSVKRDETVLFKMVNSGGEFFFDFSIDAHKLVVVALDGTDIEKFEVDSVILGPGETVDIEVRANQPASKYWIRAKTLRNHMKDGEIREVKAILNYMGQTAGWKEDPTSRRQTCTSNNPCKVLNCPFPWFPRTHNKICYSIADMKTKEDLSREYGLADNDVTEIFLNGAFNWGSSINGRKYLTPNAPLFQKDRIVVDCKTVCKNMNLGCVCSGTYTIPYNKTIQMVLSNIQYGELLQAHHPMHMHGHNFAVLKIGYGEHDPNTGRVTAPQTEVVCANVFCRQPAWNGSRPKLNFDKPAIKNTLVIPARGYAVVRFRADNPGPWLFHCHAASHNFEGMKVVLEEGPGRYAPPPVDFPRCESYTWTKKRFDEFQKQSQNLIRKPSNSEYAYIEDVNDMMSGKGNGDGGMTGTDGKNQDKKCPEVMAKGGMITLKVPDFVGLIIGCICLGVVLAIIVFCVSSRGRGEASKKEKEISKL